MKDRLSIKPGLRPYRDKKRIGLYHRNRSSMRQIVSVSAASRIWKFLCVPMTLVDTFALIVASIHYQLMEFFSLPK